MGAAETGAAALGTTCVEVAMSAGISSVAVTGKARTDITCRHQSCRVRVFVAILQPPFKNKRYACAEPMVNAC